MKTKNEALAAQLERLTWTIEDAKKDLAKAAQAMARRAADAVQSTNDMLAGKPTSMMWVEFAQGDLRTAREANDRLNQLIEQQKLLQYIASNEPA
jgi:dihydrodipicolinate synthase/N-acetylneuraminate lyase